MISSMDFLKRSNDGMECEKQMSTALKRSSVSAASDLYALIRSSAYFCMKLNTPRHPYLSATSIVLKLTVNICFSGSWVFI